MNTSHSALGSLPPRPVFQEQKRSGDYPKIPSLLTITYITLTVGILAYAGMFGIYPILLFYGMWLPLFFYKKRIILRLTKDAYIPVLMAIYAMVSTVWSDNWNVSLKGSLESASMILCSIVIARVTTLESFLKGITLGATLVLAASLIDGSHGVDYFTGDYSLVGLFASKNQLGLNAEVGAFAALLLLLGRGSLAQKIIFAILPLAISVVALYLSRSATSVISLAATLTIWCGAYVLGKFPRRIRKPTLITSLVFVTIVAVLGISLGWQQLGFSAFGKDSTLTGRTFLWTEGLKFGLQNPILGVGFGDFWIPGRQLAEALWYKFDIFARVGFHFHNTFIQAFVDLGAIGSLLIAALFWSSCVWSFRYIIKHGTDILAYYCLGISFMYLIRAFVEVDIGGTFGLGPMLLVSVMPRLQQHIVQNSDTTSRSSFIRMSEQSHKYV